MYTHYQIKYHSFSLVNTRKNIHGNIKYWQCQILLKVFKYHWCHNTINTSFPILFIFSHHDAFVPTLAVALVHFLFLFLFPKLNNKIKNHDMIAYFYFSTEDS